MYLDFYVYVFLFIDDILLVNKGTKQDHLIKVMKVLDEGILQLKAENAKLHKNAKNGWYRLTRTDIYPLVQKLRG